MTVDTLDTGLVRVTNSGLPAWADQHRWHLEEDLRIGSIEGGGPEDFGSVRAFEVDHEGRVFVLDGQAQEIQVFLPDGTFSHTIGRRGEGPGEFVRAGEMYLSPDGNLWVTDTRAMRYSVFDRDGQLRESYDRDPRLGVIIPSSGAEFTRSHGLIEWARQSTGPEIAAAGTRRLKLWLPVRFMPPATYDTLPPLEEYEVVASNGRTTRPGGGLIRYVASDGAVWFADVSEYIVYRRSLEGDTTLTFSLPADPVSWTRAERDSLLELYGPEESPLALIDEDFPETKPVIREIFGDDLGHIYVIPQLTGVTDGLPLDVFRDSGQYLGRLTLPERLDYYATSPIRTATHLYATVYDELNVAHIVRWRIVRP